MAANVGQAGRRSLFPENSRHQEAIKKLIDETYWSRAVAGVVLIVS